ncbi:MAG: ABC-ATPase domain-containing protein [Clostridiales bacterium]|nr:ABC-ATPase domain-containing protein [Clostridiales bacterium]
MKTAEDLRQLLLQINRKSYPAYKDTRGVYTFPGFLLSIDHVQGDPFAAPSKISVKVSQKQAGFPESLYHTRETRIALQDYLIRQFCQKIEKFNFRAKGSGKSGLLSITRCRQEILERTACTLDASTGEVTVRMEVGFPANGRTINSPELIKILFDFLPICVKESLYYRNLDGKKLEQVCHLAEDQTYIRQQLPLLGLCAFVANGSVLPRESGVSPRPMKDGIPFRSPDSMEVTLRLPHHGPLKGMGIPKGITLIVGGGYHGKSTLLEALELGVYNHIAGDGREYVITESDAVKIRAEDGRSIKHTDISLFINDLPNGKQTSSFYSEDASGSTSQAANVVEAMETGSHLLLIDEDTSATNFMIRDELMQRVVNRNQEPITPFIERVQWLAGKKQVSTILVAGSSGSYFHVADTIIQMDHYKPVDITAFAQKEAEAFPSIRPSVPAKENPDFHRIVQPDASFREDRRLKMKPLGVDGISVNRETIDLRYLEQLADSEQVNTLAALLRYAQLHIFNGRSTMQEAVKRLEGLLEEKGLSFLAEGGRIPPNLAMPRIQEVYACLNRFRSLKL